MSELTASLSRIKTKLGAIETDLNSIQHRISGVESYLPQVPTSLQIFAALIATWSAGAVITAAIIRFMHT
jgi:hypothetical protein